MMRDGGHLAVYDNHDAMRREIARHSRHDAEAYDRYVRDMLRHCRFIKPLLLREPPDPTSFRPRDLQELLFLGKHFHKLGEARMYDTLRFFTMSCADMLDEYFESEIVKAHLCGSSIIGTALGPRSPGTAYVLLHHYMGSIDGAVGAWGFARGGMGAITQALAASFRASGGTIRASAPVDQIRVRNGRATGVVLEDGEEISAPVVVSNLDVKRTFLKTVAPQDLAPEFLDQVRKFKIRGSSGKLNIALDGLPRFPAIPQGSPCDARRHAHDRHARDGGARLRRLEGRPLVARAVRRHADPVADRPDDGARRQALHVGVRAVLPLPARRRPVDPSKRKAFGQTVIDAIARHSPDFKDLILHAEIRTPWDIENEVGLTEGNIFQGELTFDQLLFNRPIPGYAQYRAPLRGHVHVRLEHPSGRWGHGGARSQFRQRDPTRPGRSS